MNCTMMHGSTKIKLKFNTFTSVFWGTLYFYIAACSVSLNLLYKSVHFFRPIAFHLRHTNPYITLHFRLLFSCMLYKIHTNDSRNEKK